MQPHWLVLKKPPPDVKQHMVITVPRRRVRLSTDRSRLKRLIREAVRLLKKEGCSTVGRVQFLVRGKVPPGLKTQDVKLLLQQLIQRRG